MFCPNCGVENDTVNQFCLACGSPLPKIAAPIHQTSSEPENEIADKELGIEEVQQEPEDQYSQPPNQTQQIICPNCEQPQPFPVPEFCQACGFPLTTPGEQILNTESKQNLPIRSNPVSNFQQPARPSFVRPDSNKTQNAPAFKRLQKKTTGINIKWLFFVLLIIILGGAAYFFLGNKEQPELVSFSQKEENLCQPVSPDSDFEEANRNDLEGDLNQDSYFMEGQEYTIREGKTFYVPEGITLIIEPGARVKFGRNSRMVVNGELLACGTAKRRILFTADASTGQPGFWQGIEIKNADKDSVIAHANFEFGGGDNHPVIYVENTDFALEDLNFDNNRFYSLSLAPDNFPEVVPPFKIESGPEGWEIREGILKDDLTWEGEQPLVVNGNLEVQEDVTLTIRAGSHIKFLPKSSIQIYGKVAAMGTPDAHILITGASEVLEEGSGDSRDTWSGILFAGDQAEAELNYVDYRYEAEE